MKRQDKIFFRLLLTEESPVKFIVETAAKNNDKEKKVFCTADLWNMRRRKNITVVR